MDIAGNRGHYLTIQTYVEFAIHRVEELLVQKHSQDLHKKIEKGIEQIVIEHNYGFDYKPALEDIDKIYDEYTQDLQ